MAISNLKKSIKSQLQLIETPKSLIQELPKTIGEFSSLITIRSGNKLVPFELYQHQEVLLDLVEKHRGVVGVKSRQMGATQAILLRFLYKAAQNPAYSALVFSKGQDDTSKAAFRCREMIKSLDGLITLSSNNLETLRLENGGTIFFRNSKIDGARGIDSVSDILYDEAGFAPDIEHLYGATDPCQAMVGNEARTIVLSTPNGQSGWYFDRANENNPDEYGLLETIEKVRKGELPPIVSWIDNDGWAKYVAHWKCHPIYGKNDSYLEEIARKRKIPTAQVLQEYDLSFEDSAERMFSPMVVKQCAIGVWEKQRVEGYQYYVAIDPQFGGQDYCVCGVIKHDVPNNIFSLVDWYRKRSQSKNYHLSHITDLIDKYNPENIAVEKNSGGQLYYEELVDLYPHLIITPIATTGESKPLMVGRLRLLMETMKLIYPEDRSIKDEFYSFEKKGKLMQAISGKHDDIVMMFAIASAILPVRDKVTALDTDKIKTVKQKSKRTYVRP